MRALSGFNHSGDEVALFDDQEFSRTQILLEGRYGFNKNYDFGVGIRYRDNRFQDIDRRGRTGAQY